MSEFKAMLSSTPLAAGNAPYVEAMYERFLGAIPDSVEPRWREYFASLGGPAGDVAHGPLIEELARRAKAPRRRGCRRRRRDTAGAAAGSGREAGRRLAHDPDLREPRSPRSRTSTRSACWCGRCRRCSASTTSASPRPTSTPSS
ncbi:MAG: hypothetical protein MZW92_34155 [Comamonadaceae bacterium]|nr:hypothetical protein [Comamonadaceae bacterium]